MAGSSSKSPLPTFCGEGFIQWSNKMKRHLILEGVWYCVEEGFKKPKPTEKLNAEEMEELKQDMVTDARALSLIRQSLSSSIFMRIVDAKTAKEAWDTLHTIFQDKTTKMNKPLRQALEDKSSSRTVKERPHVPKNASLTEPAKRSDSVLDVGDDDGSMPLSGDKPFFDMVLMKSAVKPACQLNFPARVDLLLPSTNMKANVSLYGKIHEILFYGERKQKAFGCGWRQLVDIYNLEEGDFVVFEVMESNDTKLELNLQILKCTIPPELEQEIARRELKSRDVINLDDDDNVEEEDVVVVDDDEEEEDEDGSDDEDDEDDDDYEDDDDDDDD